MMAKPVVSGSRPSFIAVTREIFHRDGLKGFYRGLAPTLLRAFPSNACAFFVYEGTMRVLGAEKACLLSVFFSHFLMKLTVSSDSPLSLWRCTTLDYLEPVFLPDLPTY